MSYEYRIPAEHRNRFRECEYLESTGTQYIDTGIKLSNEHEVGCEFSASIDQGGTTALMGTRETANNSMFCVFYQDGSTNINFNFGQSITVACDYTTKANLVIKNKEQSINGTIVSSLEYSALPSVSFGLFAYSYDKYWARNSKSRVYSFSISRNGVKQCDYVPAYDTEEKRPCMFDLVTNTPKYNSGTGEFKYRYATLPALFEQVEYLEGTGTQWIQCGNFPENEVVATFDSQFTRIVAERQLFGLSTANPYMGVTADGLFESFSVSADTNRHTYQISCNREKNENIRSIVDLSLSNSSIVSGNPQTAVLSLIPFSLNLGSYITKHLRCYSARVVADGTLAMDLIPCRDIDDRPCMFDLVSQRAYYNQGTGEFIAPDVNRFPEGYTRVRYLEANGTNKMEISFEEVENVEAGIITQWTDTGEGGTNARQLMGFNDWGCFWGIYDGAWQQVNGGDDLLAKQNFTVKMTGQTGWIDANNGLGRSGLMSADQHIPYKRLGLCNIGGVTGLASSNRIFYTYITTDGRLLRRLYPCLDEKGKPCLFDIVEQVPFYGTGKFIAPGYDELPEGYTRCKYLESTGTQYIDTGIKLSNEHDVSLLIEPVSFNESASGAAFGSRDEVRLGSYNLFFNTTHIRFDFNDASYNLVPTSDERLGVRFAFTKIGNSVSLNDASVNLNAEVFTNNYPCYLFGVNSGGVAMLDSHKVYSFSISRAGVLQCNYIPALDPDGRPCMYDTVTEQAFYNQNTGDDFLYEVLYKPIPKGYKRCKYLESSGTQYIDTGIKLSNESEVRCEYEMTQTIAGGQRLYGVQQEPRFVCYGYTGGYITFMIDSTETGWVDKIQLHERKQVVQNSIEARVNGTAYQYKATPGEFITTANAWLFSAQGGSSYARIYSFSISRNGILQQYLIPCLDNTGKPCMYDAITGISLYNLATGGDDFSYELLQELPAGYERCEYLESTGTQWIDTGVILSSESEVSCDWELVTETPTRVQYVYGRQGNDGTDGRFCQFGLTAYNKLAPQNIYSYVRLTTEGGVGNIYTTRPEGRCQTVRNKEYLFLNGALHEQSNNTTTEPFELQKSAYIFADSQHGYVGDFFCGRIYSFSISKSGVKQCDLVPCRDEFGTPCMYDLITGNTLYNKGQGEFIAPKVKYRHVPASFRQIEYLESDGNQFIELPVHLNQDSQVIMSYELPESPSAEFPVFGSSSSVGSFVYKVGPSAWTATNGIYTASQSLPATSFTAVWMQASHIRVNDKNYPWSEAIEQEYDAGYCALFGQSTSADPVKSGKVRIGCVAIYRKGILESMLVPCRDDRLRPCMYDVISQTAHYNSGTGEFSGPIGGGLPAGYLRLDYLESTGTQWIDTGWIPQATDKVKCTYEILEITPVSAIFGNHPNLTCRLLTRISPAETSHETNIMFFSGEVGGLPIQKDFKTTVEVQKNQIILNGEYYELNYVDKVSTQQVTLFGQEPAFLSKCKVYSFIVTSEDIPLLHLIPALDPTGKPCMYDLCYNKAYYNKASGADFSYQLPAGGYGSIGNKIKALGGGVILPDGYKQVNCLESTGTQWIDTGYIPQIGDSILLKNVTMPEKAGNQILFTTAEKIESKWILLKQGASGDFLYKYFESAVRANYEKVTLQNSDIECKPDGSVLLDGVAVLSSTSAALSPVDSTIQLMGVGAYMRVGVIKIDYNGALQLNYIPALDPSGRPCMYDLVTGQPKYNQGTGEFLWG